MLLGTFPYPSLVLKVIEVRTLQRIKLRWYVQLEVLLQKQRAQLTGMYFFPLRILAANQGIRLLRAAEEALIPGSTTHGVIVETIREDHIASAKTLIRDREILGRVERGINFECKRLEDFLNAAQVRSQK